jgi:AcrR family transcriptional regulator
MKTRNYVMDARADGVDETRQRILAGARRLFFEEWYDDVRLSSIAEAAGVSHQTVLNHFGSKEGVFAATAEVVEAELKDRGEQVAAGDTGTALRLLLEQYEEMGLANARMVLQEHRVAALHDVLERARAIHRAWVESVFAQSLPASGTARRRKIAAFLAATEVMAWKAIRHDYGFSKNDTAAAITALVRAIEESS